MKVRAALAPIEVVTVTLTLPSLALAGTFTTIFLGLQETYCLTFAEPNATTLLRPRSSPNHLPLSVTVAPRLPGAGESLESTGLGTPCEGELPVDADGLLRL